MNRTKKQINLFIIGEDILLFRDSINSLENKMEKNLNINIINNKQYSKNDYLDQYYKLIDKAKYFNVFAVNYKTKKEILDLFESFNNNYNETGITSSAYPFFLIDRNVFNKMELYNEIKKINSTRDELYRFFSKDIISYDNKSLKDKIFDIYNYFFQEEIPRKQPKTLNIMVCGKKGIGKTYFINELLFENRGLSKENNYTTKITGYEHKFFPIMLYDFPGFSDNEDKRMFDTTNYISQFNEEFKNLKNKIHIIFYMLQNDSSRVLQDKEIELIEKFIENHIPIFLIANRVQKNNIKTFTRNTKERITHIKTNNLLQKEKLKSSIFILDSSNKSIKNLLDAVIKELQISKNANENIINQIQNKDSIYNIDTSYVIVEKVDEDKKEKKMNKIIEEMKKSIFFNDISKTFKNVETKIKRIIEKIQNDSNTHLIPLLNSKNDLIQLFNELKQEFENFLSEEKIERNFPQLNQISTITMDENSIGLILDAILSFICILAFGTTGTFSLLLGLPIYVLTRKKKKENIELLLRENANQMFTKFKSVSLEGDLIEKTAQDYNIIIDKFIEYSKCFNEEHENDMDLFTINNTNYIW